jgi:CRISPR-associated protein Cmr1
MKMAVERLELECEIVTPMFLGGADGKSAELRASSIKGALRFWWRAMLGNLSIQELYKQESQIFGSVGENSYKSPVSIRIKGKRIESKNFELVPHKPFMKASAFSPKETFQVVMTSFSQELLEQAKNTFILTCILGGFGKRVRRGMGSVTIKKVSDEPGYKPFYDLPKILELLNIVNPGKFQLEKNSIISNFKTNNQYPYIKQIQTGRPSVGILRKISDTTHQLKDQNREAYQVSLGHAFKGRFASPIYVSTVQTEKGLQPIITTLNAAPNKDTHKVSKDLQEDFKRSIL